MGKNLGFSPLPRGRNERMRDMLATDGAGAVTDQQSSPGVCSLLCSLLC